jgi:hypothetical protein
MKQQLSPEKYILTKARSLPIFKCLINQHWKEKGMANVVVMRSHVNGNVTVGYYLIDLFCLGIKDTHYQFNEPREEILEMMEGNGFMEIEYNLAHNIVYAGHDYAYEFDIHPHKDFTVTKFILEEDNDNIELIEVHTGDEQGNPYLMVSSTYLAGPILQKLKQHAGEGNYTYVIEGTVADEEGDDFDEDGELEPLSEMEDGVLDLDNIMPYENKDLLQELERKNRCIEDLSVIVMELAMRRFMEMPEFDELSNDNIEASPEYVLYENTFENWLEQLDEDCAASFEKIKAINKENILLPDEELAGRIKNLILENADDEILFYLLLTAPFYRHIDIIKNDLMINFASLNPLARLYLVVFYFQPDVALPEQIAKIADSVTIEAAIPGVVIHGEHCKVFWLIKGLQAIGNDDDRGIIKNYQLLSVDGIGNFLKGKYCTKLSDWLLKKINPFAE